MRSRRRWQLLVLTVWLLIFSAHHAAPDAPIWMGGTQVHHHHSLERAGTALSFSAAHDHNRHGHCELCFSGSFHLLAAFAAPPRHLNVQNANSVSTVQLEFAGDVGLPDAHAPPRV
jgi:hypothetical protein